MSKWLYSALMFLLLSLSTVTLASGTSNPTCAEGLNAYKATMFPFVRSKCIACHDAQALGPEQGPEHSVVDPEVSYGRMLSYLNTANLSSSRLITKGGNNHCASYGVDCGVTRADLEPIVQAWWEQGQKNCTDSPKFLSASIQIPSVIPSRKEGFTTLELPLYSLGNAFSGSILQVKIQKFSKKEMEGVDAYRLHSPRVILLGSHQAIRLKGLHFLLNGKWDSRANGFSELDRTVNHSLREPSDSLGILKNERTSDLGFPNFRDLFINSSLVKKPLLAGPVGPTLTSGSLILFSDQGEGNDVLSASFDWVEEVAPLRCKDLALFEKTVLPILKEKNCTTCHSDGSTDAKALAHLFIPKKTSDICSEFIQRVRLDALMQSPLLRVPSGLTGEHLPLLSSKIEQTPFIEWIRSEMKKSDGT